MTDEQRTTDRKALYAYLDAECKARQRRTGKFSLCASTPRDVAHAAWAKYTAEDTAAFDAFVAQVLEHHADEKPAG